MYRLWAIWFKLNESFANDSLLIKSFRETTHVSLNRLRTICSFWSEWSRSQQIFLNFFIPNEIVRKRWTIMQVAERVVCERMSFESVWIKTTHILSNRLQTDSCNCIFFSLNLNFELDSFLSTKRFKLIPFFGFLC